MMECRMGCGACCSVISISSPLPGMPFGKPAGVRCAQLTELNQCRVWGTAEYPEVCRGFRPEPGACGSSNEEAYRLLGAMELSTAPSR